MTEVQSQVLHSFSKVKGGRTVLDVVEDTGLSQDRVRSAIKVLMRDGALAEAGLRSLVTDPHACWASGSTAGFRPPKVYRAVEEL